MGALDGQVIMQVTDSLGQPMITITWFFDPVTRVLRNNPIAWTAPDGTVYPIGTGAVIGDNRTAVQQRVLIRDTNGTPIRWIAIPANGGRSATATQLANTSAANGGPYTSALDFNGMSFELS